MLAKRIIPCLDVKDGKTVKGTNFVNLRDAGDAVELGIKYSEEGADELVFLDITASHEERKTFTDLVMRIARNINIPFTIGGGINEKDKNTQRHQASHCAYTQAKIVPKNTLSVRLRNANHPHK